MSAALVPSATIDQIEAAGATALRGKAVAPLLRRVRLPTPADATPPAVTLAADPNPAIVAAE